MKLSKLAPIMTIKKISLAMGMMAAAMSVQATPMVAALTTGNVDLTGDFTYALTMNPYAAGTTVGDATFTSALNGNTAGVSISNQYYIQNWHYSAAANATGLGDVMRSIIWSGGGNAQVVQLSMSNLQIGNSYKAQLLFGEACCNRGFDIFQNGVQVANDFSPFGLNGNAYSGAAIFSDTFTATSTSVVYGLGYYGAHPDWNPILNAATLENLSAGQVPEPAALPLVLAGLVLFGFVARKKSAH